MNVERLESVLIKDEGKKLQRYVLDDTPHIGIGHNIIGRELADDTLDFLGITDESQLQTLTDEQCEYLFHKDIEIVMADIKTVFGETFEVFSDVRQEVIANMMFNLGIVRFKRFRKFIEAAKRAQWEEAGEQILDSDAARSELTGKRYKMLAEAFRTDDPASFGEEFAEVEILITLADFSIEELLAEIKQRVEGKVSENTIVKPLQSKKYEVK